MKYAIIAAIVANFFAYEAFGDTLLGGQLVREGNKVTHGVLYVCKDLKTVNKSNCRTVKVNKTTFKATMKALKESFNR